MKQLKNCPFCGATPHRKLGKPWSDQLHGERHQNTVIECPHLCSRMNGTEDATIMRWNHRTAPPLPTREEVARAIRDAAMGDNTDAGFLKRADAVLRLLGGETTDA